MPKNISFILLLIIAVYVSGCATFGQIEKGLDNLTGRHINEVFGLIGYPSFEQNIAGKKVYVWINQNSGTLYLPTTSNVSGFIGNKPVYGTVTGNQPYNFNYQCEVKLIVDSSGYVERWQYAGNIGGCEHYAKLEDIGKKQKQEQVRMFNINDNPKNVTAIVDKLVVLKSQYSNEIIGRVLKGQELVVIGEISEMYYIRFNGGTGWVNKWGVK